MAEKPPQLGADLDQTMFCCSVCLDLFKEPVTVPCGHSYCKRCIEVCWQQQEEAERPYSCPQCRELFQPCPVLRRNNILAEVVEKLKGSGTKQTPLCADVTCAGPDDVACDFCCETRRNKASMSCLTCLASYCDSHLEPHYGVPVLKTHQLVSVTVSLKERICKKHNKLMEFYCQTDQICICHLCFIDEHRGHRTVSVKTERDSEQKKLIVKHTNVQKRLLERERELKELHQALKDFESCTQTAVEGIDEILDALVSTIQIRRTMAKQMISLRAKQAVAEAEELQHQLKAEIIKLGKRRDDLYRLSLTRDHIHFIQTFPALSSSYKSPDLPPGAVVLPEESMKAAFQLMGKLKHDVEDLLKNLWPKLSAKVATVNVVLPPVPKSREQFLLYGHILTLDVNTVHRYLCISEEQRRVTLQSSSLCYSSHSDRFGNMKQVLCREALSERCYWEVRWKGYFCAVAVAYKDISRSSEFGYDSKSWSLECSKDAYVFRHGLKKKTLSGPLSGSIGVYLDYNAGLLAFYSLSERMTLLHKEQTRFFQPLYPGIGLKGDSNYLHYGELVKLW